ncbi:MAG: hypothetical protein GX751_07885 [Desulfuromonadaceae bacterium]|nr:hypothetical protein [Desulfuromonadaceae bacterium]
MTLVRLLEAMGKWRGNGLPVGLIVAGLLLIFEALFVNHDQAHTAMEKIPGFWSIFGFLSCVVIVFFSKWLAHVGILKPEDYYDE